MSNWTIESAKRFCETNTTKGLKYWGAHDFLVKMGEWDAEADAPKGSKAAKEFHAKKEAEAKKAEKSNKKKATIIG